MRKFDTKVQYLKYKVLREVAKQAWAGTLEENILDIPKIIVPGKVPTMRCCVYKERAILTERVKMAMGGDKTTRTSSKLSTSRATNARWAAMKSPTRAGAVLPTVARTCVALAQ